MSKNLIMTAGSAYNYNQIKPFFTSLERTDYSGDVVFFYNHINGFEKRRFDRENRKAIPFNNMPPFLTDERLDQRINIRKELLTKTLRYLLYKAYLKENSSKYEHVMIADLRDVFFQDNPFKYPLEDGITTFLEDESETIRVNGFNSEWIKVGFGKDTLNQIGDNLIACSGVSYGTPDALIVYIEKMVPHIERLAGQNCRDQGIHNYLVYTNALQKVNLIPDDKSLVSTIAAFKDPSKIISDKKGNVLNNKGELCPVVHQYDRNWKLLWKYNKPYYFQKRWNLIKRFFYPLYLRLTGQ
jgi:hypothetical protein